MSVTTPEQVTNEGKFATFRAIAFFVFVLGLIIAGIAFVSDKSADRKESHAQATIATLSEELNVEVLDYNVEGLDNLFVKIRNSAGDTFHCDYPFEFDGELHNCFPVTTIGANGTPVK